MALTIRDRVVVFDYGEVISQSPSPEDRDRLLTITGLTGELLWPRYEQYRHALDRGTLSVTDYWNTIASEVGVEWTAAQLQQIWAVDFSAWLIPDPATVNILAELAEGETRLAILSNAGFDFASAFRFSPIGRYFERVFVSAEMDALKPDPEIYLRVATELGITPAEMVFVDNKSINTEAARRLGITVHHFVGAEGLREFLASLAA